MDTMADVCDALTARRYIQVFGNSTRVPIGQEQVSITAPISGQAKFYRTDGSNLVVAVVKLATIEFTAQRGRLAADEPRSASHSSFLKPRRQTESISMAEAVRQHRARRRP